MQAVELVFPGSMHSQVADGMLAHGTAGPVVIVKLSVNSLIFRTRTSKMSGLNRISLMGIIALVFVQPFQLRQLASRLQPKQASSVTSTT
jgi:hypothetical protein